MAKQVRSAITRDRIVQSAAHVFDRYGYAATTLSDIVRQSGTTKGSVYFHFTSKEEVAIAVVSAQHDRSMSLMSAVGSMRGLEAGIWMTHKLGRQIVDDSLVRAGIRLTLEQASSSTWMVTPYKEWIEVMRAIMEEAVSDGDVHESIDVDAAASFLVGSFTGIQLLSGVTAGRRDLPARLREMWTLLLPGFAPQRKVAHFERLNALYCDVIG